jgi:CheY-like chemotaxis protein
LRIQRADGPTALLLLRSRTPVDVLFTDIVMPGLNGIELARRALQQSPNLKVLFVSGYTGGLTLVSPLLKKPYLAYQLAGKIAAVLDE